MEATELSGEGAKPVNGKPIETTHPTGRAAVIVPVLRRAGETRHEKDRRTPEARLEEAVGLAGAIDLDVALKETVNLARPVPATLFGRGQVERFAELVKAFEVDLVVVDAALTPVQQRNLETRLNAKVIDRTALILWKSSAAGPAPTRDAFRSNWPPSLISARASCEAGRISNGNAADTAFSAVPAKASWKSTGG